MLINEVMIGAAKKKDFRSGNGLMVGTGVEFPRVESWAGSHKAQPWPFAEVR